MVKMTIKQCVYFLSVAQEGGIAQAARALAISQPAVSQAIDKLESQYGMALFKRHHARGVELTAHGRSFILQAKRLVEQAEQTEKAARRIASNKAGIVRLGVFHTIAPFYLPQIIKSYSELYPDVSIESYELQQDEIFEYLATGKIDMAITYDMALGDKKFEKETLIELPTYVLLNSEHACAQLKSISLHTLEGEPYVMFEGPSSRDYFEGRLKGQGVVPKVSYQATSMQSVRSAVANNLGYSLAVMVTGYGEDTNHSKVRAIPIIEDIDPLPIVMVSNIGSQKSNLNQQLLNFCSLHFNASASYKKVG